jgi:hypothetical protein
VVAAGGRDGADGGVASSLGFGLDLAFGTPDERAGVTTGDTDAFGLVGRDDGTDMDCGGGETERRTGTAVDGTAGSLRSARVGGGGATGVELSLAPRRGDGRFIAPGTFGRLTVVAERRSRPLETGRGCGRECPVDCDLAGRGFPSDSVPKEGVVANITSSCKEPMGLAPPLTRDMAETEFARWVKPPKDTVCLALLGDKGS